MARTMFRTTLAAALIVGVLAPSFVGAKGKQPPPANPPTFTDVSVHDPSVIKVDDTYYVFGSHLASAKTKDLMQWTQISSGVSADNPLFENVLTELKETFDWAQSDTLWAPDVVRLKDGRFYMYYNACKGDSPRSAMGVAVADNVEGPYKDLGIFLKSGMWDEASEDGTIYDARVHPNVVDPNVFYDHKGQLWMVYGSYSGGIFIMKMDESTGKPVAGQGYGKKLLGGNHSRIEGTYILYSPDTRYYYLFMSFGGLAADGGYNIRVARSRNPDGPYYDAEGTDMINVKANPDLPLFDDASIEPYGVKLMGNFLFDRKVGDPGSGIGVGYVSPGHNSAYYDAKSGKYFLFFHTRFPQQGETHQVRVHQMFMNQNGWPVVAPYRYTGETADSVRWDEMAGSYKYINHNKAITSTITLAQDITLLPTGKIGGAVSGTWLKTGPNAVSITIGGKRYSGVFAREWNPDEAKYTLVFTALSKKGVAIWGRKYQVLSDKQAVDAVVNNLTLGDTSAVIANLTLPTEGTQQSTIAWQSSDPAVVATTGVVTRPTPDAGDATVTLTASIAKGSAAATKSFTVVVKAKKLGGLVAHYAFDGSLADSAGLQGDGTVMGALIDQAGGSIGYDTGVKGQAAVFDGASGVKLPSGLFEGSSYSVALWLKPAQLTAYTPTFFGARDANHWVSLLPMGHSGVSGRTMVWSGSVPWYDSDTGLQIPANEWSHVAFTVNEGTLTIYVDGVQTYSGADFPDVFTTTDATFALGVNWWDAAYQGQMDDLWLYDSVLTADQVAALAAK